MWCSTTKALVDTHPASPGCARRLTPDLCFASNVTVVSFVVMAPFDVPPSGRLTTNRIIMARPLEDVLEHPARHVTALSRAKPSRIQSAEVLNAAAVGASIMHMSRTVHRARWPWSDQ